MSDFETLRWSIAHDPCNPGHRSPMGTVPTGASVDILLWVDEPARPLVRSARLLVGSPPANTATSSVSHLDWRESPLAATSRGFAGTVHAPAQPQTLFYLFALELSDGTAAVYAPRADGRATAGELLAPGSDGELARTGWVHAPHRMARRPSGDFGLAAPLPGFQVTVHEAGFDTPGWLAGAVMYQIFPDRFARGTGGIRKEGLEYHRRMKRPVRLHAAWNDSVDWEGGREYDPVDFFGGTLDGIREKLPYLASLGVEVLYLNPVFEARSNHRYDTADYGRIDPLLGTEDDFSRLAREAREAGIRVVLDAVLSHTGSDSRYFNARGSYPQAGAAQSAESPYRGWYDFEHPNGDAAPYRCWWGDPTLPEVEEHDPTWQRYILGDPWSANAEPAGILPRWVAAGAGGYRLDVADEIPDDVLERIRHSVKAADPQAAVIGEVWEDATSKVSYGAWRTYALGTSLDSVMNYPLRSALLGFGLGTLDARQLSAFLKGQRSNYPAPLYRCLMNLMSSHDVERQRSILARGGSIKHLPRERQAEAVAAISPGQDEDAARLQRILAGILYALPGVPCLYYGDERGLHGGGDPFCRATFPWDAAPRADRGVDLTACYQQLGRLRRGDPLLRTGDMACCAPHPDVLVIARFGAADEGAVVAVANRSSAAKPVIFDACELAGRQAAAWDLRPLWPADAPLPAAENEGGMIRLTIPPLATVYFRS